MGDNQPITVELDLKEMFRYAMAVCRSRGFPVHDSEYGSAINEQTWQASQAWRSDGGSSPHNLAAVYALRECGQVAQRLRRLAIRDEHVKARPLASPTLPTPLADVDFHLLSFAAHHGLGSAAVQLELSPSQLRQRLDEIAMRIERASQEQDG